MIDAGTTTTAVEQAFFRSDPSGHPVLVAGSLTSSNAESAWTELVGPYARRPEQPPSGPALTYLRFPQNYAAVLHRTRRDDPPGTGGTHALLGFAGDLSPAVALGLAGWSGWADEAPHADRMPRLGGAQLPVAEAAAASLRARAIAAERLLRRALAGLLRAGTAPLGIVGCPENDRVPLLWGLLEIAEPLVGGRDWTFSTHDVAPAGFPPGIVFLTSAPAGPGGGGRAIVDLTGGPDDPAHDEQAAALVRRYTHGDEPAGPDPSAAPLLPAAAHAPVTPPRGTPATAPVVPTAPLLPPGTPGPGAAPHAGGPGTAQHDAAQGTSTPSAPAGAEPVSGKPAAGPVTAGPAAAPEPPAAGAAPAATRSVPAPSAPGRPVPATLPPPASGPVPAAPEGQEIPAAEPLTPPAGTAALAPPAPDVGPARPAHPGPDPARPSGDDAQPAAAPTPAAVVAAAGAVTAAAPPAPAPHPSDRQPSARPPAPPPGPALQKVPADPGRHRPAIDELAHRLTTANTGPELREAVEMLDSGARGLADRSALRDALEHGGWGAAAIQRLVNFDAVGSVFDRVVWASFGERPQGRELDAATSDARRIAETTESDGLVLSLARWAEHVGRPDELAPALAARWQRQHEPVPPDPGAGLGPLGRLLLRYERPITRAQEKLVLAGLLGLLLLVVFLLGVAVGAP